MNFYLAKYLGFSFPSQLHLFLKIYFALSYTNQTWYPTAFSKSSYPVPSCVMPSLCFGASGLCPLLYWQKYFHSREGQWVSQQFFYQGKIIETKLLEIAMFDRIQLYFNELLISTYVYFCKNYVDPHVIP